MPLVDGLIRCLETGANELSKRRRNETEARSSYCRRLYRALRGGKGESESKFCPKNATWFQELRKIAEWHPDWDEKSWISYLEVSFSDLQVDFVPGSTARALTARRCIRLEVDLSREEMNRVAIYMPGSKKRKRLEADLQQNRSRKTRLIKFRDQVPFRSIPAEIGSSFEYLKTFSSCTRAEAINHYEKVQACLKQHMGEHLCDLVLIIAMVFHGVSGTPVAPTGQQKGFQDISSQKRIDKQVRTPALIAALLWWIYPDQFPEEDEDQTFGRKGMRQVFGMS